jgi:hypothetical protein
MRIARGMAVAALLLGVGASPSAQANGKKSKAPPEPPPILFTASLNGFQEVPSVSTSGSGRLKLRFDPATGEIQYRLRYEELEGEEVLFAHIHFGQRRTNGGVSVFLCTNELPEDAAPVPPECPPPTGGVVAGVLTAADVLGPQAQGIAAEDLEALLRAMRAGATYANVHTDLFPGGEIRGQISEDDPPPPPRPPKPPKKKDKRKGPPPWWGWDW